MNRADYETIWAGNSAVFPLADRARWKLSGPDAERYLNGQTTADITQLRDGAGTYAAVCTAKGKMEGDLFIARHGAEYFLDAAASLQESFGVRLDKYLIADDAQLEEINDQWSLVHVFGAKLPALDASSWAVPRARFGFAGHDIWTEGPALKLDLPVVEADVVDLVRLEHGIPCWNAELSPAVMPPEAGPQMLAAISYTKGCYVGQETIARLKSVGRVNRTLVFLRSQTSGFPASSAKILAGDREVGFITSSAYSPRLGVGAALGFVTRTVAEESAILRAEGIELVISEPCPP